LRRGIGILRLYGLTEKESTMGKVIGFSMCAALLLMFTACGGGGGGTTVNGTRVNLSTPENAVQSFVRALNDRNMEALGAIVVPEEFEDEEELQESNTTVTYLGVTEEDGFTIGRVKFEDPDIQDEEYRSHEVEFAVVQVDGEWRISSRQLIDHRMREAMEGYSRDNDE
jgi:hypothetical protein